MAMTISAIQRSLALTAILDRLENHPEILLPGITKDQIISALVSSIGSNFDDALVIILTNMNLQLQSQIAALQNSDTTIKNQISSLQAQIQANTVV